MENLHSQFSILRNSLIIILTLLICCAGCINKERRPEANDGYSGINEYFQKRQKIVLSDSIKKIFVLTETGCAPCNKNFSKFIEDNVQDRSSLFLITASGTQVDLSPFGNRRSNVLFDQQIRNTDYYDLFNKTKVIFLKNKKVDTIINIDASRLEEQFEMIRTRK